MHIRHLAVLDGVFDQVAHAAVQSLRRRVDLAIARRADPRVAELENDVVVARGEVQEVPAEGGGLFGEGPRHGLEGHGRDQRGGRDDGLCRLLVVVVEGLEKFDAGFGVVRERRGLGGDEISLALEDELVVRFDEVDVGSGLCVVAHGTDGGEVVEDAGGGLEAVVEEEHDPDVDQESLVLRQNDGGFVVGVVCSEVVDGLEERRGVGGFKDEVAAPDLMVSLARDEMGD